MNLTTIEELKKYSPETTVKDIIIKLEKEQEDIKQKEREYEAYIKSFTGKYIVYNHNGHSFDFFKIDSMLFTKCKYNVYWDKKYCGIRIEENSPINHLKFTEKSKFTEITQDQYENLITQFNKLDQLTYIFKSMLENI